MHFRSSCFLLLSALALLAAPARAQILTPTTLRASLSQPAGKVGTELELVVTATVQAGWHLYSSDFDPNVGPAVFALTFAKSPAYALVGKPRSVGSKRVHDDVFNGEVAYFEKTGQVRQRIRLLKAGPFTIRAEAEYQSCSEADGRCVPGNTTLTFGPVRAVAAGPAAAGPAVASASTR